MDIEKELERLREREDNPPAPGEMARLFAAILSQLVAQRAFELFRDKKFRKLTRFVDLEQTEQDRIFNELVVSGLILTIFLCESPDMRVEEDFREYLGMVKDAIREAYVEQLAALGVEEVHLKEWETLIGLRYDEYVKGKLEVRQVAMDIESQKSDLTTDSMDRIRQRLPVQTVAIGCHDHICRGETNGRDDLLRLIVQWLGRFYGELKTRIEKS